MNEKKLERSRQVTLSVLIVVFVVLFSLLNSRFFSAGTLQSIAFQLPEIGILTMAMAITMITGGINLSCIASANLSSIIMVAILTHYQPEGADSLLVILAAMAVGLLTSVLIGVLNGLIISDLKVPAMLATLSTSLLIGGINIVVTKGIVQSYHSDLFSFIGNRSIGPVPVPILIFVGTAGFVCLLLRYSSLGNRFFLYGSSPVVSAFNGVSERGLLVRTYAISGLLIGIAAIVMTARFSSASASYAGSYLLQTVLISVLAGVDPDGGRGRTTGLVLAILLIQVLSTGFNAVRVEAHLSTAILGLILLGSIAFQNFLKSSE